MPATPAWLARAEAAFNRHISASESATALARRLQNTALQVDIEGVTRIRAAVGGGRLALLAGEDSPADATISGSPVMLLRLFSGGAERGTAGTSAQIRGDAETANLYRQLIVAARPDFEEELSRWVGDFPARSLARLARQTLSWVRSTRRTAGENIAEYLQEESRDLVNKTELEEFLRGVDEVRETADRIAARLGRLERRLQGTP